MFTCFVQRCEFAGFLLLSFFTLTVLSCISLVADDSRTHFQQPYSHHEPKLLELADLDSTVDIELEDLVEGLATVVPICLKNSTHEDLRDLSAKVSCECLRVDSLEGRDLAHGDSLDFKLTALPTAEGYSQKLSISTGQVVGERKSTLRLNLSGKVRKSIVLSRFAASTKEIANDPIRLKVSAEKDVNIDFSKVAVLGGGLRIRGFQDTSELELSVKGNVKQGAVLISLPFKWKGKDFAHTQVFDLVDDTFEVAPSKLYFRRFGDKYIAKAVIRMRGTRLNPAEIVFRLVGVPERRDASRLEVSARAREVNTESCFVELSIDVHKVGEIEVNQPVVEILTDANGVFRSVACVFESFP